jgi:hypothetical protein
MSKQVIAIGSATNDRTGDKLRVAFTKVNDNFTELYTSVASLQAGDADLTAIGALTGTSGFLKKTAANTWALDTSAYLTSITSSNVTTALGFTPYNATNPSGYITSSALSGYALTSSIPTNNSQLTNGSGYITSSALSDYALKSYVDSYIGVPQSTVSTTNTLLISDAGKHIYVTTAEQIITIPANASVAYPIGTTIQFIAGPDANIVTIRNNDTMYLSGTGTTGDRSLAAYGIATAIKVDTTTWFISGNGLT